MDDTDKRVFKWLAGIGGAWLAVVGCLVFFVILAVLVICCGLFAVIDADQKNRDVQPEPWPVRAAAPLEDTRP